MRRKKREKAVYVQEGSVAEGLVSPFPKRQWCDPFLQTESMQHKIIRKGIPLNIFFLLSLLSFDT